MFIGEPGGSNRSRGLLLEEIRYTFRHKSFTTESRNDSLSHGTTIHLYIVSHNDDLSEIYFICRHNKKITYIK